MKRIGVIGTPGGWSSERLADALGGFRGLQDACGVDAAAACAKHVLENLA